MSEIIKLDSKTKMLVFVMDNDKFQQNSDNIQKLIAGINEISDIPIIVIPREDFEIKVIDRE